MSGMATNNLRAFTLILHVCRACVSICGVRRHQHHYLRIVLIIQEVKTFILANANFYLNYVYQHHNELVSSCPILGEIN